MDEFKETKRPNRRLLNAKLKGCSRLNVRSGPSADSTVSGVITATDRIKIEASTKDREWVTVYEPIYGFAKKTYIEVI